MTFIFLYYYLQTMKTFKRQLNVEQTQKDYKRLAPFYGLVSQLTEAKAAEKVVELANIGDGMSTLEVACGTGVVFEKIVRLNPNGQNTGIDITPEMLSYAKIRLKKAGVTNFSLKKGNALQLNFEDDSFDLVINNFMMDLMPEDHFLPILSAFHRVLKPSGTLVMANFSFGTKQVHKLWTWVAKKFPALLTGCRPVVLNPYIKQAGFTLATLVEVSQNTFPSTVIKATKL